jgi:hypothetical protein
VKEAGEDYYYDIAGTPIEVQVVVPKVELKTIKFNHKGSVTKDDPGPDNETSDGLNIRKSSSADFAHFDHTQIGEWTATGRNEPFLYVADKTVTVKARFTMAPNLTTTLTIGADAVGGVFPNVTPKAVDFVNGVSSEGADQWVEFSVSGKSHEFDEDPAKDVAKSVDLWKWKITGGIVICDIGLSGPHTNYCVLDVPKEPWYKSALTHPWVNALDYTCVWAAGQTTQDAAAGKSVVGLFAKSYETQSFGPGPVPKPTFTYSGDPMYLEGEKIQLSGCIDRLNGIYSRGKYVNCVDCANFVMAFSNLAGHSLYTSQMFMQRPFSDELLPFDLNKTTAIGGLPFTGPGDAAFEYHAVAWNGTATSSDDVFDACVKVDGDLDPTVNPPGTEACVDGMAFEDVTPGAPYVYRERLAAPGATGYDRCIAQPSVKSRTPIE